MLRSSEPNIVREIPLPEEDDSNVQAEQTAAHETVSKMTQCDGSKQICQNYGQDLTYYSDYDILKLAQEIVQSIRPLSPTHSLELPPFSGLISEWLPFKNALRESTNLYHYTPEENMLRLHKCLTKKALQHVEILFLTTTDPEIIMKSLEERFWRRELIIDWAFEEIRSLKRPGSSGTQLQEFATKLERIVDVIRQVDDKELINSPTLLLEVIRKLSLHLKFQWCDYAEKHEGTSDPDLVLMSRFIAREAKRSLKFLHEDISANVLLSIRKLQRVGSTPKELEWFATQLEKIVEELENSNNKAFIHDPIQFRAIEKMLNQNLFLRWCDYAEKFKDSAEPEVVLLLNFVKREANIAQRYLHDLTPFDPPDVTRMTNISDMQLRRCPCCYGYNHALTNCPKYQKILTVEERWELLKANGLCFRCVNRTHRRFACRAKVCGVDSCSHPHHASLHEFKTPITVGVTDGLVGAVVVAPANDDI